MTTINDKEGQDDRKLLSPKDDERMLLELAAKAAGIELGEYWTPYLEEIHNQHWNPLRNDGQALRLAVKLKISVLFEFDRVIACYGDDDHQYETEFLYEKPKPTDSYAATRRAIVRAAAEIGKGIKQQIIEDGFKDNYYKSLAEAEALGRSHIEKGESR